MTSGGQSRSEEGTKARLQSCEARRRNKDIWVQRGAASFLFKHLKDYYVNKEIDRSCRRQKGWDYLSGEKSDF